MSDDRNFNEGSKGSKANPNGRGEGVENTSWGKGEWGDRENGEYY